MAVGRPPKYDADFHPADCERMGLEGKFCVEMATAWGVDAVTIYEWCHSHKEFSNAFTRAKGHRAGWMMQKAREGLLVDKGKTFNAQVLGMMLKYDGIQLDERLIKMPALAGAVTFAEKAQVIVEAFANGAINGKEANQAADLISKSAKIDEVTELRRMLEEVTERQKQSD